MPRGPVTARRTVLLALAAGVAGLQPSIGVAAGAGAAQPQPQPQPQPGPGSPAPAPAQAPPGGSLRAQRRSLAAGDRLSLPPVGRWQFGVYYGSYERGLKVAVLDYEIGHDGRRYRIVSDGRAEGLAALVYSGALSQESVGRLTQGGLEPMRYREQRGKRPERWAEIDRERHEVRFSSHPPIPLVGGVQDRLSVLVQLGLLARAHPERFAAGRVLELPELGSSRISNAHYAIRGEDLLTTPAGAKRALHLERIAPRDADDARIDVWLGYDLDMLPVRLRFTDPDGRVLDQLIRFP